MRSPVRPNGAPVTVRDILQIGHPVLRQQARPLAPAEVATADVQRLVDDLVDTMRAADGAGLAATQVGEAVQVCVAEVRPGNPRYPYKPAIPLTVLVNPQIETLTAETFANYEGCLSVPGLRGVVERAVEVRVRALDRHGAPLAPAVRRAGRGPGPAPRRPARRRRAGPAPTGSPRSWRTSRP